MLLTHKGTCGTIKTNNKRKEDIMYSEMLKKEKITLSNNRVTVGVEVDKAEIVKMIDCFCKREDIIGVPTKVLFNLFDKFCEEKQFPKVSHLALGRIFREHFSVDRKKVRKGKELFWVYVPIN